MTLMDVQSHEQFVRLIRFVQETFFLAFAALPVRHIYGFVQIDDAAMFAVSPVELHDAVIYEGLGMSCLKEQLPCRIGGDQPLVLWITLVVRKACRT